MFVVLSFIKWGAAEKKSIIINGYEWAKWNNLMKVGFVMGGYVQLTQPWYLLSFLDFEVLGSMRIQLGSLWSKKV